MGGMNAVNIDETVRLYSELLGAPPGILYSPEEVEQRRTQQEQQTQQMQQAIMAEQQASAMQQQAAAANNLSQAQMTQAQMQQMGIL